MTSAEAIAALDRALATAGEDVILRRVVGTAPNTVNVDVACRAQVRTFRLREDELASAIAQGVLVITISPTDIARAQWPGGELPNPGAGVVTPSLPRRGDILVIKGRTRLVEAVDPIAVDGEMVRFDLQVQG